MKVLNRSGSGSMSGVILGIDHAVSNCDGSTKCVVNMSLGGSKSTSLNMAVANAVKEDVLRGLNRFRTQLSPPESPPISS